MQVLVLLEEMAEDMGYREAGDYLKAHMTSK